MRINIYTSLNGVGLEKDYNLVRDVLESAGHDIEVSDWQTRQNANEAAIAFHMEVPRYDLMKRCRTNILIPNAEWFSKKWTSKLKLFTEIWAKTKDGEKIFKKLHKKVICSGFLSEDLYMPDIPKSKIFIHIAGQSRTKGTGALVQAYKNNKDLPKCFLISSNKWECTNNLISSDRLSFADLKMMLNSCVFHVCCSEYEGWGHYIHEPLGCKSVVITTDSAPMNEFVTDERLLVPEFGIIPMHMAHRKLINSNDLAERIREVYELSDAEIKLIGEQNRAAFLNRNKEFKKYLLTYIKQHDTI